MIVMSYAVTQRHQFMPMAFYIMKMKFEAYSGKLHLRDVNSSEINWYLRVTHNYYFGWHIWPLLSLSPLLLHPCTDKARLVAVTCPLLTPVPVAHQAEELQRRFAAAQMEAERVNAAAAQRVRGDDAAAPSAATGQ
jgi:hypothetical protein